MANETYTLIQKTTLNESAASITFSSIPQTFTDLKIVVSARTDRAATDDYVKIGFNGVTTNQTSRILYTVGTTAQSTTDTLIYLPCCGNTTTASTFGYDEFYIPNYTSTTNAKSLDGSGTNENNATAFVSYAVAGLWNPGTQAAITSIVLTSYYSSNFTQYSSFALYGVAKEGVTPVAGPKASGGDIITNDGTYWIHQFLNSGTFTPSQTLSTDYLIVAGGGGGGTNRGGGGGAGGYRNFTAQSLTAQSYAVTVGAGGTGGNYTSSTNVYTRATKGTTSVFNSTTSSAGGTGAENDWAAESGGSGGGGHGGATYFAAATGNSGSYSPVEGFAGGAGAINTAGGGGGGSSAVGSAGSGSTHPQTNKGAGTANSITGSSVTYAEGGNGGGGAVNDVAGVSGTVNRGSGGSGASNVNTTGVGGGNGGSGIVIIRYAI